MLSLGGGAKVDAGEGCLKEQLTGTEEKGGDTSRTHGCDKDLGGWHGREAQQIPGLPQRRWE